MASSLKVLVPDSHHHYHHKRAIGNLLGFIKDARPDEVCILGDFLDCKAPARWSRGTAEEYAADLQVEAAAGRQTLKALRDVYDGPVTWLDGNHEARISTYVKSHAPALKGIVKGVPELLDFEGFRITPKEQPYILAPGVGAIHGNLLSKDAGMSAMKEVRRHGISIVQGHSHRLGLVHENTDRQRFALECGWLGDVNKAAYLPFRGVANWQLGFGLLRLHNGRTSPVAVPVHKDGSFVVEGQAYS